MNEQFTPFQSTQAQQTFADNEHEQAGLNRPPTRSPSTGRTLRRTPRLEQPNTTQVEVPPRVSSRRTHLEAASIGIPSPPKVWFAQPQQNEPRPAFSSSVEADSTPRAPARHSGFVQEEDPTLRSHPVTRVSKHTASAILYALEEALRKPHPFTPDLLEERASMSDLREGTGGSRGGTNNGAGNSRMAAAPAPTGSPQIKGPRDIMRERAAREARKKAEQEAIELERLHAEAEQRAIDDERRRSAEKRAAATGITGGGGARGSGGESGYRSSGGTQVPQRISDNSQRSQRTSGERIVSGGRTQDAAISGRGTGGRALGGGEAVSAAGVRVRQPTTSQSQARPTRLNTSGQTYPEPGPAAAPAASSSRPAEASGANRRTTQSSFPHAFERWETLSSHWEGLTSFWMRRLEENSNEIQSNPLSQQLSRQVTDLSAAGANLFHAVVELQRLRASSERKFQRWFFETRQEQERSQEVQALLENTLQEERRGRAEAIADAVAKEKEKDSSEKLIAELRRELQISKEEARRAWEELGRREQEERERTVSLREGLPTVVGGVQVVPMMQGVPSRQASTAQRPQTRDGPYPGGPAAGALGGQEKADVPNPAYASSSRARTQAQADPFVETATTSGAQYSNSTPYTGAPAVQHPSSSVPYYPPLHPGATLHPTAASDVGSQGTYSEGEYEIEPSGAYRRDSQGRRIPYGAQDPPSDEEDDYESQPGRQGERAHLQQYGHAPVSGVEYGQGSTATAGGTPSRPQGGVYGESLDVPTGVSGVDYTGEGYGSGSGPGWEAIPRHHHPTRLSDVLEEDERSRTSASQVSRRE